MSEGWHDEIMQHQEREEAIARRFIAAEKRLLEATKQAREAIKEMSLPANEEYHRLQLLDYADGTACFCC